MTIPDDTSGEETISTPVLVILIVVITLPVVVAIGLLIRSSLVIGRGTPAAVTKTADASEEPQTPSIKAQVLSNFRTKRQHEKSSSSSQSVKSQKSDEPGQSQPKGMLVQFTQAVPGETTAASAKTPPKSLPPIAMV